MIETEGFHRSYEIEEERVRRQMAALSGTPADKALVLLLLATILILLAWPT